MPDAIQIKRADVAADIRMLAELTGLSITDAVGAAVRAQLAVERVQHDSKMRKRRQQAEDALAAIRRLPVVGPELSDDDLYDEQGLPR